jgi:uncharacterized protein YbjQ (UPF0145 family)
MRTAVLSVPRLAMRLGKLRGTRSYATALSKSRKLARMRDPARNLPTNAVVVGRIKRYHLRTSQRKTRMWTQWKARRMYRIATPTTSSTGRHGTSLSKR